MAPMNEFQESFLLGVGTALMALGLIVVIGWHLSQRFRKNHPNGLPEDPRQRLQKLESRIREQEAEIADLRRQLQEEAISHSSS
jgi:hypothetical protein